MKTSTALGLAIVVGVAIVVWRTSAAAPGATPATSTGGDPVTGSISLDLKVKAQSEFAVRLMTQTKSMREVMALGLTDSPAVKTNLDEAAAIRAQLPETRRQLATLGDSPASIARWLDSIHYDDFLKAEAELRKSAGQ
ncbi:MAG: hypothetical protein H0X38_06170 [Planctomycetes bacterium]|nr:hypothetical protein [Planctomycetota bacterium]